MRLTTTAVAHEQLAADDEDFLLRGWRGMTVQGTDLLRKNGEGAEKIGIAEYHTGQAAASQEMQGGV